MYTNLIINLFNLIITQLKLKLKWSTIFKYLINLCLINIIIGIRHIIYI